MGGYHQKTAVRWDQSEFEKARSGWSQERIDEDKKSLQKIFNQAACVPALKRALDWAQQHDVQFFVDHTCMNAGGCYTLGSGIVSLIKKDVDNPRPKVQEYLVGALTHEIRHAWQDYNGFFPASYKSFSEYFIKMALMEADAYAHGMQAEDEFRLTCLNGNLQENSMNENYLGGKFLEWFSAPRVTAWYGSYFSEDFAKYWGLCPVNSIKNGTATDWEIPGPPQMKSAGIDIAHLEGVLQLGKSFSGQNYLAKLPTEVLTKKVLSPWLAQSFYGAANDDQKKLTTAIRKCELRRKFFPSQ
jgi:hypothetical protein